MLELHDVEVAYGAIRAVRGVSLRVDPGEVVTIIGANGAGKTTLLKGIAGLERLSGGKVMFRKADCSQLSAHARVRFGVALAPEGRGVFADQTVHDNLLLGAYLIRADKARNDTLVERGFQRLPRRKRRTERPAER